MYFFFFAPPHPSTPPSSWVSSLPVMCLAVSLCCETECSVVSASDPPIFLSVRSTDDAPPDPDPDSELLSLELCVEVLLLLLLLLSLPPPPPPPPPSRTTDSLFGISANPPLPCFTNGVCTTLPHCGTRSTLRAWDGESSGGVSQSRGEGDRLARSGLLRGESGGESALAGVTGVAEAGAVPTSATSSAGSVRFSELSDSEEGFARSSLVPFSFSLSSTLSGGSNETGRLRTKDDVALWSSWGGVVGVVGSVVCCVSVKKKRPVPGPVGPWYNVGGVLAEGDGVGAVVVPLGGVVLLSLSLTSTCSSQRRRRASFSRRRCSI